MLSAYEVSALQYRGELLEEEWIARAYDDDLGRRFWGAYDHGEGALGGVAKRFGGD